MESVLASDTEETNSHAFRHVHSDSNVAQSMTETSSSIPDGNDHQEYEKQADEMLESIWNIYDDDESWTEESKSEDGADAVTSKVFSKWGKVFRLIVRFFWSKIEDFFQFLLGYDHWIACKDCRDVIRTSGRDSQMESIGEWMQSKCWSPIEYEMPFFPRY